MEFGPIFRALLHNKTRFALIALEIALTLAVVVNCLNMIRDHRSKWVRPTGMDVENLLTVESQPFAPEFKDDDYVEDCYDQDLSRLRSLPGVKAVTGMSAIPLSGGGNISGRRPTGSDMKEVYVPYYVAGSDALETLGVELVAGRLFTPDELARPTSSKDDKEPPSSPRPIIITQALADRLFPDGDAVGKTIGDDEDDHINSIVGIIHRMHCSWPLSSVAEYVALQPGRPATSRESNYLIRVEPGQMDSLFASVESELFKVNPGRVLRTRTLLEIKARQYRTQNALSQLLWGVSAALIAVTALGIIGLTSFSVTERRRQIGTRRALGATRLAVLRYFLVENWIITGVGLTLGIGLSYGLNYLLAHVADVPTIAWMLVAGCMLLLWLAGLLAALAPALRGTSVPPVVATRSV